MKHVFTIVAGMAVLASSACLTTAIAGDSDMLAMGKKVAFDRKKGNCLSCHMMEDGKLPGTAGPPLIAMKGRYPDKAALRQQIWDATEKNPLTPMPPFGRHGILTKKELDMVVEYVYSL